MKLWRREHKTGGRQIDSISLDTAPDKLRMELVYDIPDEIRAREFAAAFNGTVE